MLVVAVVVFAMASALRTAVVSRWLEMTGIFQAYMHDYEGAVHQFSRAIEIDPSLTIAYLNRGSAHYELGEYQAAEADYTAAVLADPNCSLGFYLRGQAYRRLDRPDLATGDFTAALGGPYPAVHLVHFQLGETYRDRGMVDEALSEYGRSIEVAPTEFEARWAVTYRGLLFANQGLYDLAVADLTRAIEADPYIVAWRYKERAMIYERQGLDMLALTDLKEYVRQTAYRPDQDWANEEIRRLEARKR